MLILAIFAAAKYKRIIMRNTFVITLLCCLFLPVCHAQKALNLHADDIVGTYYSEQGQDKFKVRIVKMSDATYKAQVIWVEHRVDEKGNVITDRNNPDKNLRSTPCDRIVLMKGLQYNAEKKRWDGTKIYDPQRGIRANVSCEFLSENKLKISGKVLGIGETVYWKKLE